MAINVFVDCEKFFKNEIEYTLKTFLDIMGVEYRFVEGASFSDTPDIYIIYSEDEKFCEDMSGVFIKKSTAAEKYFGKKEQYDISQVKRFEWDNYDLPVLFANQSSDKLFSSEKPNRVIIHQDIVASAFFLLSCWQELVYDGRLDRYNRFPYRQSLQYRLNFVDRPIVNDYLNILRFAIETAAGEKGPKLIGKELLAGGKDFAVCLTHDVDRIRKCNFKRAAFDIFLRMEKDFLMGRRPRWRGKELFRYFFRRENPLYNLEAIVRLEKKFNFASTFFLMASKHSPHPADYELSDPLMENWREILMRDGCEIGLHGGFRSSDDRNLLRREKETIEDFCGQISGIRQHYLRLNVERSFRIYEELRFEYDTTLGFAERCGFRSSFSFPHYPYNIDEDRAFRVLEIPLVIMDTSLEMYMKLDREGILQKIENMFSALKKFGGAVSVLWHNNYFDDFEHPGFRDYYEFILQRIEDYNGSGTTASDVWKHFSRIYKKAESV